MGAASTTIASSLEEMQWMWKSNCDPWDTTQTPEWSCYNYVENMIIEEAYQAKKTHATLLDYRLDFSQMVQIGNNDINKKRPVKRVMKNLAANDNVKEETVFSSPIAVNASTVTRPGAFGDFIWEAYLLGQWRDVSLEILVERAAQGIIQESKKIGKRREAEQIAKYLYEVKRGTRKQIWQRCARAHNLESFLYVRLNETLRLVNSEEHKQEWKSRLKTLGLFAWFLFDLPQDVDEFEGFVYMGSQQRDEDIEYYKTTITTGELLAFPTFTSTSRNRSKAEPFGNILFIISVIRSRETSVDVSAFSEYPQEEEQLLIAGFLFKVTRVEFDATKNKHIIYLQDCNNQ